MTIAKQPAAGVFRYVSIANSRTAHTHAMRSINQLRGAVYFAKLNWKL
jgi:hypothetical protein